MRGACLALQMVQLGGEQIDVEQALLVRTDAQFDVAAADFKCFVEAAQRVETFGGDGHAGAGVGQHVAGHGAGDEGGGVMLQWLALENVVGPAAHAGDDHACVLDGVVGVQQEGAYGGYVWQERDFGQALQPVGGDDFGVVVQEHQHLARAWLRPMLLSRDQLKGICAGSTRTRAHLA